MTKYKTTLTTKLLSLIVAMMLVLSACNSSDKGSSKKDYVEKSSDIPTEEATEEYIETEAPTEAETIPYDFQDIKLNQAYNFYTVTIGDMTVGSDPTHHEWYVHFLDTKTYIFYMVDETLTGKWDYGNMYDENDDIVYYFTVDGNYVHITDVKDGSSTYNFILSGQEPTYADYSNEITSNDSAGQNNTYDSGNYNNYYVYDPYIENVTPPKSRCGSCNGRGYFDCTVCNSTGKRQIKEHSVDFGYGKGYYYKTVDCYNCNGKGQIMCKVCHGQGEY